MLNRCTCTQCSQWTCVSKNRFQLFYESTKQLLSSLFIIKAQNEKSVIRHNFVCWIKNANNVLIVVMHVHVHVYVYVHVYVTLLPQLIICPITDSPIYLHDNWLHDDITHTQNPVDLPDSLDWHIHSKQIQVFPFPSMTVHGHACWCYVLVIRVERWTACAWPEMVIKLYAVVMSPSPYAWLAN